ncbi:MAG TPA: hypothetical protein VIK86_09440, partial [Candidatus Paceibacterota bacterium]
IVIIYFARLNLEYEAKINIRRREMSNNITFENMLILLFPFLEVVFLASTVIGMRLDKKILKIISFVTITFMYLTICIVLWANKNV